MTATFTAVGVGPGDPELLTLRGARVLREADVVMTPVGDRSDASLALSIVEQHLDPARQQILTRTFPMRQSSDVQQNAWRDIAAEVAALVRAGKKVAFVTLGDPFLYSTFLYLYRELQRDYPEVPVANVPGISSIQAAASLARLPLGLGDETLTVVPATASDEEIETALQRSGTVVLLKVYRAFARLRALLQRVGLEQQAVYVRRVGLEGELLVHNLGEVSEDDLDYLSLILVRPAEAAHG